MMMVQLWLFPELEREERVKAALELIRLVPGLNVVEVTSTLVAAATELLSERRKRKCGG
jgi:hypothetical protein